MSCDHRSGLRWRRDGVVSLMLLGLVLLWDASGLDLPLARLAGGAAGFPWRDHWLLATVLHQGARLAAFAAAGWLLLGFWRPVGPLKWLPSGARLQWLASLLLTVLLVNWFKHTSHTSCPWDLVPFGGAVGYVPHWPWLMGDGGAGHCFPAGHASAGFGFIGGYFALRGHSTRAARACLWLAAGAGLVLGATQQLRGAHFMSHTLWTAWLSWASAVAVQAWAAAGRRVVAPAGAPA